MFIEGIIAFIGATDFAASLWIGIELDASLSKYLTYIPRKVPTELVFLSVESSRSFWILFVEDSISLKLRFGFIGNLFLDFVVFSFPTFVGDTFGAY